MVRMRKDGQPDRRFKVVEGAPIVRREPGKDTWTHDVQANSVTVRKNGLAQGTIRLNTSGLQISCGVVQISNVSCINNLLRTIPQNVIEGAFLHLVNSIKKRSNAAYAVMSNNDRATLSNTMLDKLATVKTDWERNPNSGNQIKVWTF